MPNLSWDLIKRIHATLRECDEFNKPEMLQAIFNVRELRVFRDELPEASNKRERIDLTVSYLSSKQLNDDRPALSFFLTLLRDRRHPEEQIYLQLDELLRMVEGEGAEVFGDKDNWQFDRNFLQQICLRITQRRMATAWNNTLDNILIERNDLLREILDFLGSDKRCFILVGASGSGKTTFSLSLQNRLTDHPDFYFVAYTASSIDTTKPFLETLGTDFSNNGLNTNQISRQVLHAITQNNHQLVLLIDAINEHPLAKDLLIQLDSILQNSDGKIKIVITSRPEAWLNIRRAVKIAEMFYYRGHSSSKLGPFRFSAKMEIFSPSELAIAFEKYRLEYQIKSTYEEIPDIVRDGLRTPLNLWLIAETYRGKFIPNKFKWWQLIKTYLAALIESNRLTRDDLIFLETRIVAAIAVALLSDYNKVAPSPTSVIKKVLSEINESEADSLNRLLDTEILIDQIYDWEHQITFKFENFFDYFVGTKLYQCIELKSDNKTAYLSLIKYKLPYHPYLWGSILTALQYEVEKMDAEIFLFLTSSNTDIEDNLIIDSLLRSVEDNRDQVEAILTTMFSSREPKTRKIATSVAGYLYLQDLIIRAGKDKSIGVRKAAINATYHIWRQNSDMSYAIMNCWAEHVTGFLGIPQIKIIEVCVIASILLLTDIHLSPTQRLKTNYELRAVWQKILSSLLFLNLPNNGSIVTKSFRSVILLGIIKVALRVLSSGIYFTKTTAPKMFASSFPISKNHIQSYENLIECFYLPSDQIIQKRPLLTEILLWNDILSAYAVVILVLSKLVYQDQEITEFLANLYIDTFRPEKAFFCSGLLLTTMGTILNFRSTIGDDEFAIYQRLSKEYFDKTQGLWYSNEGDVDTTIGLDIVTSVVWVKNQTIDATMLVEAIKNTLLSRSVHRSLVLKSLIRCIYQISSVFQHPDLALETMKSLLSHPEILNADSQIRVMIIQCLAEIKRYYPHETDEFLNTYNLPKDIRRMVDVSGTVDETWIQTLFPKLAIFIFQTLPQPEVCFLIEKIFQDAMGSRNLGEWLNRVISRLVNSVYGMEIEML